MHISYFSPGFIKSNIFSVKIISQVEEVANYNVDIKLKKKEGVLSPL